MNITDLKNAVNGIDFDKKKQEQMILEIQERKDRADIWEPCAWRQPLLSVF